MTLQEQICKELPNVIKPSARKWLEKELVKARVATKFIGDGVINSSTDRYRKLYYKYNLSNLPFYRETDVVWISANGNRKDRIPVTVNNRLFSVYYLIDTVIAAKASIIADTKTHIMNTYNYNIGELELANYLLSKGYYRLDKTGIWKPEY